MARNLLKLLFLNIWFLGYLPTSSQANELLVKSYVETKFDKLNRQTNEIACGAAALSTILTYYFGLPTTQDDIFGRYSETLIQEKRNFSFADMQSYLGNLNIECRAFKVNGPALNECIVKTKVPIIVHIRIEGLAASHEKSAIEGHFSLLVGRVDDFLFIKDPAFGKTLISEKEFLNRFSGFILFALPSKESGILNRSTSLMNAELGKENIYFKYAEHLIQNAIF